MNLVYLIVPLLIVILSFVGNSLTITAVLRNRDLNTSQYQLIVGLAISDILVRLSLKYNLL
jgi:hypothetical protein